VVTECLSPECRKELDYLRNTSGDVAAAARCMTLNLKREPGLAWLKALRDYNLLIFRGVR
jgi:hypothetical protein